jgi:hypothetical protein
MAGIIGPINSLLIKLGTIGTVNQDGGSAFLFARIWNNQVQLEKDGEHEPYPKPAAFVEVIPGPYEQMGQGYTNTDLEINLHLVHEYYNADGTMAQDLDVLYLRDQILVALNNTYLTGCSKLVFIGEQQDFDHDNIYHLVLTFKCNFVNSPSSQYPPDGSRYIEKEAPTGLTLTVTKDNDGAPNSPAFKNYIIPK